MTKRNISGGFDLSGWDLPKISNLISNRREKAEKKIEAAIEELFEPFGYSREFEKIVLKTVEEVLSYSVKNHIGVRFFKNSYSKKPLKPGHMQVEIAFSDFDAFTWTESVYTNISETVEGQREDDGYIPEDMEEEFLAIAKEFKKCANILERYIRPRGK